MQNRLKQFLEDNGISQTDLAMASKVSLTTINKVCNQVRKVKRTTESKILIGLNELLRKEISREDIFPES